MINISGHLRDERKTIGFFNNEVPIMVNCCGKQIFQTQNYFCNRKMEDLIIRLFISIVDMDIFILIMNGSHFLPEILYCIVLEYHNSIPIMQMKNQRFIGSILQAIKVKKF